MKNDLSISYSHVLAMFMILLCHLATYYEKAFFSQLFLIGVEMFFFISGYLNYSHKSKIQNKWLLKKFLRIYIPVLIYGMVIFLIAMIGSIDNLISIFPSILGYNGISKLIPYFQIDGFDGLTHLWFITVILICYVSVAIVRRVPIKKAPSFWKKLIILGLLQIIFSFMNIRISYIVVFWIGYYFRENKIDLNNRLIILSNITLAIALLTRLLSHLYFDGSWLYLQIVIPFTNNIIAVSIFFDIRLFIKYLRFDVDNRVKKLNWLIEKIESISYEVYIVHYIFIEGFLSVFALNCSEVVKIVLYFTVPFLCAYILHMISNFIFRISAFQKLIKG